LQIRAVISLHAAEAGVVLHHNNREQKSDPNKNRKSKSKKIRIQDPLKNQRNPNPKIRIQDPEEKQTVSES
jgi:hypothetical protein